MDKAQLQIIVQACVDAIAAMKAAVDSLPDSDPQVAELQKKIEELLQQLDSAKATLASEEVQLAADEAKIAKLREILA